MLSYIIKYIILQAKQATSMIHQQHPGQGARVEQAYTTDSNHNNGTDNTR